MAGKNGNETGNKLDDNKCSSDTMETHIVWSDICNLCICRRTLQMIPHFGTILKSIKRFHEVEYAY